MSDYKVFKYTEEGDEEATISFQTSDMGDEGACFDASDALSDDFNLGEQKEPIGLSDGYYHTLLIPGDAEDVTEQWLSGELK